MKSIQTEAVNMESNVWNTPMIRPLPDFVHGTEQAVIDLNDRAGDGTWRFLFASVPRIPAPGAADQDFDTACLPAEGWKNVAVPCELAALSGSASNPFAAAIASLNASFCKACALSTIFCSAAIAASLALICKAAIAVRNADAA